ncbi:MAG: hypothetical protein E7166_04165 [Firmicutes bacterium]|nr:hypothetical protein [Bacillota bacterium]
MMPKQKSSNVKSICCFILGIITMGIISIRSFSVYDIIYLVILIFYFIRFLYLIRVERRDITKY